MARGWVSFGGFCPEKLFGHPRLFLASFGYRSSIVVRLRNLIFSGQNPPKETHTIIRRLDQTAKNKIQVLVSCALEARSWFRLQLEKSEIK